MYKLIIKRAIDFIIAMMVFVVFWWVYLILIIAIKVDSPGPAIFKQERIGKNGKVFVLRKFRSMYVNSEHTGSGVYSGDDDPRVTAVGRFIRKTSLDELPQLINLLNGDMSLIGPRPPLTYHPWPIEEYTQEQLRMFEVRPGMSGWAQVHGRREVEWNERIRLNVWYVDNISFALDIKILFKTIYTIIFKKDNANTEATVKK